MNGSCFGRIAGADRTPPPESLAPGIMGAILSFLFRMFGVRSDPDLSNRCGTVSRPGVWPVLRNIAGVSPPIFAV